MCVCVCVCVCVQTPVCTLLYIKASNFWVEADRFLNILRISASIVLKTFLSIIVNDIIVSIECTFLIFHSHKQTGSTNQPLPWPA